MHPDANAMADLWAPMLLARRLQVPKGDVDGHVLRAFLRWNGSPEAAA